MPEDNLSTPDTMGYALNPTANPAWIVHEDGCDPLRESSRETRFAISNGFLGVRGEQTLNRGAGQVIPPCMYVAGLFDTPDSKPAVPGLVPAADWLQVRIALGGVPLLHCQRDASPHALTLDMKRGVVLTESRHIDAPGTKLRLRSLRLLSLKERAIGLQMIQLETEEGEDEITFEASFDGMNLGLISESLESNLGVWHTKHSGKALAIVAASSLWVDGQALLATTLGQFKWSWSWKSRPGQIVCFERMVAVTRADTQGLDSGGIAREKLGAAKLLGWRGVLDEHEKSWGRRWRCSDVEVDGDAASQKMLRFALYHLNGAANPGDERISIGARGLTGGGYLGHVFWDTDIFLLPFYTLTWPEAARALLMYRFHTLDGARAKATRMGWRGALYAWESADSGAEATPEHVIGPDRKVVEVFSGKQEQHISADVAYAVWQYWRATGDDDFMRDAGAEILFETARFWTSRAVPEADGYHHIRGVIGPDEYHENIDDNAFTNVMARWNIRRALDVAAWLRDRWPETWEQLSARLGLDKPELQQWLDAANGMATGLDVRTGLFEQFAGFHKLEEICLADYAGRSVPMDAVLGKDRTQGSQVVKQADVVALLALLPEEFDRDTGAANFRYYQPRCSHGSSLSRPMHGLTAARLGYSEMALQFFKETAAIDLEDTHVAIAGGIHMAALGGIWQMAVFGFAGVSVRDDGIAIDPKLPAGWRGLNFSLQWRGRQLQIRIDQTDQHLEATLTGGKPMTIIVGGEPHELLGDKPLRVPTGRPVGTDLRAVA
jgi:trehalose/maltose hydrolase-like predicted phosphorylase